MEKIRAKIKDQVLLAKKRELILKGALSVFKEKGYHKTTVRDIAKAARVSMGTLYDCISTKADILYMFYKDFMSTFQRELVARTKMNHNPKEKLLIACRTLLEVYFSLEDELLFGLTESKNMKGSHLREFIKLESGLISYFKEIFDDLKSQTEVEIEDTYMAANFLLYSFAFGVLRRWALKPTYDKKEIIAYLMNTQLQTITNGGI